MTAQKPLDDLVQHRFVHPPWTPSTTCRNVGDSLLLLGGHAGRHQVLGGISKVSTS